MDQFALQRALLFLLVRESSEQKQKLLNTTQDASRTCIAKKNTSMFVKPTGRTPTRDCVINVEENNLPYVLNMSTMAATAQRAGYATAFYGKVRLNKRSYG